MTAIHPPIDPRTVSVVVSPKDTFSTIGPCLAQLVDQLPPGVDLLLVAGGAPAALAAEWRRAFEGRVRFFFEPGFLNQAQARAIGLAQVTTPLCVLMDGDAFGRDDWLPTLLAAQAATGAALVVPTILEQDRRVHCIGNDLYVTSDGAKAYGHKILRYAKHPFDERSTVAAGPTAYGELHCQLVNVEAIRAVGGFDTSQNEVEVDLGLALERAGRLQWCEPRAVVQFLEDTPIRPEDVALYAFRWDAASAAEACRIFEEKWGLDMTENGGYRHFVGVRAARLGLLPRVAPCAATLRASRLIDGVTSRLARLVGLPGEVASRLRRRLAGDVWPEALAARPRPERSHPAMARDWRARTPAAATTARSLPAARPVAA